LKERKKETEL
jgi:hypothetical protein